MDVSDRMRDGSLNSHYCVGSGSPRGSTTVACPEGQMTQLCRPGLSSVLCVWHHLINRSSDFLSGLNQSSSFELCQTCRNSYPKLVAESIYNLCKNFFHSYALEIWYGAGVSGSWSRLFGTGGFYSPWYSACHLDQVLRDLKAQKLKYGIAHFNLLDEICVSQT